MPDISAQSGAQDVQSDVPEDEAARGVNARGDGDGSEETQSGPKQTPEPSGKTYSEEEFNSLRERMRAADQRASQFEQELKKLRDKDLPEVEKLKRDFQEASERAAKAEQELAKARIENAFLADNTYKWRNPATALRLLNTDKITIDSDGTVTGLRDALDELAKSDPYLLDDVKDTKKETKPGTAPANNGSAGGNKPDRNAVTRRFPALRTRV